jgi:hypothetical protein
MYHYNPITFGHYLRHNSKHKTTTLIPSLISQCFLLQAYIKVTHQYTNPCYLFFHQNSQPLPSYTFNNYHKSPPFNVSLSPILMVKLHYLIVT